jgi:hypothetical protein
VEFELGVEMPFDEFPRQAVAQKAKRTTGRILRKFEMGELGRQGHEITQSISMFELLGGKNIKENWKKD